MEDAAKTKNTLRTIEKREFENLPNSLGKSPSLEWVSLSDLRIDDTFQRELGRGNWTAIRKIAETFNWSFFTPVTVAPIDAKTYSIIDGQHRAHAVAALGLDRVPCQIVQLSQAEQAKSFSIINGNVVSVTLFHVYKAAVAAGEKWAIDCDAAVSAAGCTLCKVNKTTQQKKPTELFNIADIRRHVANGNGDIVTNALAGLRMSDQGKKLMMWSARYIKPLLQSCVDAKSARLTSEQITEFLNETDLRALESLASQQIAKERRQDKASRPLTTLFNERLSRSLRSYVNEQEAV